MLYFSSVILSACSVVRNLPWGCIESSTSGVQLAQLPWTFKHIQTLKLSCATMIYYGNIQLNCGWTSPMPLSVVWGSLCVTSFYISLTSSIAFLFTTNNYNSTYSIRWTIFNKWPPHIQNDEDFSLLHPRQSAKVSYNNLKYHL